MLNSLIDKYFKRPLFWDYFAAIIVTAILYYLKIKGVLEFAEENVFKQLISDLGNISLTLAGIILTLITILISFKSNFDSRNESTANIESRNNVFETFFHTNLYFDSVKFLKGGMKSLLFIGILNFTLKIFISIYSFDHWYLLTVSSIIIIVLTMVRSLLVLGLILDLQKGENSE